ncbi:MAG: hypothetical protein AABW49_01615 [Nanoarchaeota archaeon]
MRRIYLGIILLLAVVLVLAETDLNAAYTYLVSKRDNGTYNHNVVDASAASLALGNINFNTSLEKNYLKSQESSGCWPISACKIKDTAFAIIALSRLGVNVDQGLDYLHDKQSIAPLTGSWLLQIATDDTGTCRVSYEETDASFVEKEVEVVEGVFKTCGNSTFFDINNCLQPGVLNRIAPLELDVNCNSLSNVDVISIIFRTGSSYYLVDEARTSRAIVTAQNGCFGVSSSGACDLDSSLWASLALTDAGKSAPEFFLRLNADKSNAMHQALLYLITGDSLFAKSLSNTQRNDGSWGGNVVHTALAVKALENTEFSSLIPEAINFFESAQRDDGSFGGTVFDTAITLWAGFSPSSIGIECFDGQKRLCSLQAGVCDGAVETCVDGAWPGCTEETYLAYNNSYVPFEVDLCDGADNDCDGNADTGCICSTGDERECSLQAGVCDGAVETCVDGAWPGCDYESITAYENPESSCSDLLDNDCDDSSDGDDDSCVTSSICNLDDTCDYQFGEDESNCPDDCTSSCNNDILDPYEDGVDCGGPCLESCQSQGKCVEDGVCQSSLGEDQNNCVDCYCGDGVCDSVELINGCPDDCGSSTAECGDGVCSDDESFYGDCPDDCDTGVEPPEPDEPKSSTSYLWWILAGLVVLGAAGFIFLQIQKKKKPRAKFLPGLSGSDKNEDVPVFESIINKFKGGESLPRQKIVKKDSKLEEELDKSLKEARELLKK